MRQSFCGYLISDRVDATRQGFEGAHGARKETKRRSRRSVDVEWISSGPRFLAIASDIGMRNLRCDDVEGGRRWRWCIENRTPAAANTRRAGKRRSHHRREVGTVREDAAHLQSPDGQWATSKNNVDGVDEGSRLSQRGKLIANSGPGRTTSTGVLGP